MVYVSSSLPSRGAWIEMITVGNADIGYIASLPSRGAWIEIAQLVSRYHTETVAPLAGSVD